LKQSTNHSAKAVRDRRLKLHLATFFCECRWSERKHLCLPPLSI